MVKKILVPIDSSENANRALDMAFELAQKYSAEITLLTVVHYGFVPPDVPGNYYTELKAFQEKVLSDAQKKARSAVPNINTTIKLTEGYPIDEIVKVAREENVDLIVMGRRGQSHLRHTLLGSVSDGVLDQAPCTVVIVK